MKQPGQLRFNKGDRIELLSSTKRQALLEDEDFLHGLLVYSPQSIELVNTMGWFPSDCIEEMEMQEPELLGDVHDGEPFMWEPGQTQTEDRVEQGKRGITAVHRGLLHVEFGRPNW